MTHKQRIALAAQKKAAAAKFAKSNKIAKKIVKTLHGV